MKGHGITNEKYEYVAYSTGRNIENWIESSIALRRISKIVIKKKHTITLLGTKRSSSRSNEKQDDMV